MGGISLMDKFGLYGSPVQCKIIASGSELHCTGLPICQLDLLGIADYIVFVNRNCNVYSNKVNHCAKVGASFSWGSLVGYLPLNLSSFVYFWEVKEINSEVPTVERPTMSNKK